MVALIVSYFLLTYLLAPRAIFRLWSGISLPLKFERTRADEITFAFGISIAPLLAAWFLMVATWGPVSPGTIRDYQEVFAASYSEAAFDRAPERFWTCLHSVCVAQLEFLPLYYCLVAIEALVFVFLLNRYGNWKGRCRLYDWLINNVLTRGLNEWHPMLSLFSFPSAPERKVIADLLAQEDHLFRGEVADYFTDHDGALSGLFLQNARRFDRPGYLAARGAGSTAQVEAYWKEIPGGTLFIPFGKILSLNLRYEPTAAEEAQTASEQLAGEGFKVQVPETKRLA